MAAAGEQTMTELVTAHSGNASAVDRHSGRVVIKPNGIDYEKLSADLLVVTDLAGRRIKTGTGGNQPNPSVDLPHHLCVYNHCPDVCGIVHTHSSYATSFALLNRPLQVYVPAMADEFGSETPGIPYVDNAGDHIGEAIEIPQLCARDIAGAWQMCVQVRGEVGRRETERVTKAD